METLIELHDIHFKYDTDEWVLNGIDLSIGPAEYVLVCGANGSGKSTLGYLLNGLIPHFMEGEFIGNVMVNGNDTRNLTVADLAERVGLVLQNPEAQLFNATVAEDIAFGLESLGLDAGVIDARLAQVVRSLHIDHLLDRSPTELSGGEKRLAAIATVLALDPSVVVLDEPFADLDWDGVELVRRQLRELHQMGKTVIVIEQRLESVLNEASRCIILENGKV
ncbi:MAG: ABC transporter ATP-binding protein, partial [Desulfoferrobacter sp.]